MSSRKAKALNGHVTTNEYQTIKVTPSGVKILKGYGVNHSLPEYAHSPNSIYAKLDYKGSLRTLRFFNDKGYPIFEIGYHPEPRINFNNRKDPIVHFHLFNGIERDENAHRMDHHPEIKEKYKTFLKEFDLYDKC